MKIRYPPPALKGQSRQEWERVALRGWRMEEKRKLIAERGWRCERCGAAATDLDEGILPRCDMRGFSLEQRRLAFCSINCFLLCAKCNREEAHRREWAFGQACSRYGEQRVREWYGSLNLRAPDLRFMPKF